MRGREFIMKDAYSFDRDEEGAKLSYQKMYDAYQRIFTRCGLTFRAVEADTGLIGGSPPPVLMGAAARAGQAIAFHEKCSHSAKLAAAGAAPPGAASAPTTPP